MGRARWAVVAASMLLGLTACATTAPSADEERESDGGAGDGPATAAALEVVAPMAPVADLVAMVGGERVSVSSLVPAGADSHTYEPRPSDVATLSEADAYLGVGLELNPGVVAMAREHLPEEAVHLVAERTLGEERLLGGHTHAEGDAGHTHEDGEADHTHEGGATDHTHDGGAKDHTHEDGEADHTHDDEQTEPVGADGPPNPHVWTSLRNAAAMIDAIERALADLDPEGASDYAAAADDARRRIEELDAQIGEALETVPAQQRTLVAYHDAWAYFAQDHGLEMVTAVQPADYSEPSAAEVRDLIDLLRAHDVPAIFGSAEFPSDVLDTIAEETGARYVDELADDALPGEPGDPAHSYLGLMRRNAAVIVEGLGGDPDALGGAP